MVLTTMSPIAKATEGAKPITVCSEIQGMRGTLQPKEENLSTLGICFLTFVDIFVSLPCGRISRQYKPEARANDFKGKGKGCVEYALLTGTSHKPSR